MPDVPWGDFVQPDQRSCGATALVVARILNDSTYAAYVEGAGDLKARFRTEALAMHQRITSLADVSGRAQLPWPRAFGTPPWAVARQLSGTPAADGTRATYAWHPCRFDADDAFDRLLAAGGSQRVSSIFIGSTWLPRHVVLVVDRTPGGTVHVFDPARGRLSELDRTTFTGRKVGIAGWDVPWFVVTPDG
jgi:hypothetical protein